MTRPINNQQSNANQRHEPGIREHFRELTDSYNEINRLIYSEIPRDVYNSLCSHLPSTPPSWRVGATTWVMASALNGSEHKARCSAVGKLIAVHDDPLLDQLTFDHPGRISTLPPHFPESIRHLNVSGNKLRVLHRNLPERLEELNVSNNRLRTLPNELSRQLKELNASRNQLSKLPIIHTDRLRKLERLDLSQNRITELSEGDIRAIRSLENSNGVVCMIDLTGNPLSQRTINRLEALGYEQGRYRSGLVYTTTREGQSQNITLWVRTEPQPSRWPRPVVNNPRSTERRLTQQPIAIPSVHQPVPENLEYDSESKLSEAVATWLESQTPASIEASTRRWDGFAKEPGAGVFANFLNTLHQTPNGKEYVFQHNVAQWLKQLENNPTLRANTFAVGIDATASCRDRISLTYNMMRKLSMATSVSNGQYDKRLPELIRLARGMFRLEELEKIARETTAILERQYGKGKIDEIEIYLGYQVKLRDRLALPVETTDMLYFRSSDMTEEHLDKAEEKVEVAEKREFTHYLSTDFAPWQEVMKRLAPRLHEKAQNKLIDAMGQEFTKRLNTKLKEIGLLNDPDAERTVGAEVRTELAQEVYEKLTRDFLASKGMLHLLK